MAQNWRLQERSDGQRQVLVVEEEAIKVRRAILDVGGTRANVSNSGKYIVRKGEIPEKLMEAARLYLMTPEQHYFYNKKHFERAETPMQSPREPLLPAVDDIATDHMNEHRVFSRSTNREFKYITVENELQMYSYLIHKFQMHLDKLKALAVRTNYFYGS